MAKNNQVLPGSTYGNLEAQWSWNEKSGERVWKCKCRLCGKPTYIKEQALLQNIVISCECEEE